MGQTIDSRVVEMKFNNQDFEKNVAESMKTLDNLDKRLTKLENTDVHLNKVGKAADSIDLSKLDKSLDAITHRFSIMGQVGASVISNITTDAYNMVKGFGSKVWGTVFGQMKTGGQSRAQNVENAKFLLEGMGITYSKEVEDQISDAVADTAFGFDEAAMAMAQLSGASVQLGDDMDKALKGISGVAAMTNRSFSDIADIFVDAAATGKVSADAFNRLSERGLAAKSIMQEFYGVTGEELNKLAKEGKISFNDFSKAMYDAFGTQAKKSNETLNGVLANTRAVLSRMGQSFYQPLMANNSDVVQMFNSLKTVMKGFEGPVKEIGAQLSGYVLQLARYGKGILDNIDVSKYTPMFENLKKTFENLYYAAQNLYSNILKPFGKQFVAALYEVFPSLNTGKGLLITISDKIVELSQRFREFTADIGLFGEKGITVRETLIGIFELIKTGIKLLNTATKILKNVIKVIGKLLSGLNLSGMFSSATGFINEAIEIGSFIIGGIAEGLIASVPLAIEAIGNVCRAIIEAFCSLFGIASPSKVMKDLAYWLVAGIADGIKAGLKAGLITGAILLVFGLILRQFREGQENVLQTLSRLFDRVIDKISDTIGRLSNWVGNTSIGKAVKNTFEVIAAAMGKLASGIQAFNIDKFKEIFGTFKQFVMLASYIYILVQFSIASTMFTSALANVSRAASKYMGALRLKYFGATLKNLAIAIGVITGSILLFAGMIEAGKGDSLVKGLLAIIGIITALVVAVKMLQGAIKEEAFGPHGIVKVEAMFVGLAAAVYLIATAIRKVGRLDLPQLIAGSIAIAAFLVGIAVMVKQFHILQNQMTSEDVSSFDQNLWIPILAIAVSVRLIAGAIKKIAKIPPEDFWRASLVIAGLTAIMGLIGGLTIAIAKLNVGPLSGEGSVLGLAAMFLGLAIAIRAISKAIIWLSYVPVDKIEQGKSVVFNIMGWLAALLIASSFATKVLGGILLGFAATVAALAGAIWLIGQMESGIAQGIGSVVGIMTLIAGFIAAVNIINKATGGGDATGGTKALLYVAACIAAMGAVVYVCGQLEWGQIGKGLIVVGALTLLAATLGILFGLGDQVKGGESSPIKKGFWEKLKGKTGQAGSIIKTIAVIKTVVNALVKVALVALVFAKTIKDPQEITNAVLMLTGVVAALTLLLAAAGAIADKCPNIDKITKPIVALSGALLVIGGSLLLLGQMDAPATVITSMFAIGGILFAMGYVLEKAKVFGVQGMNVKGILACSVGIIAISAALTLMIAAIGEFSVNKLFTVLLAVGAMAAVIFAIAGAMKLVDKVSISMKSVGAFLLSTLSLVAIAATIALFATYVEDMKKGLEAAGVLAIVFFTMGVTLKLAETVNWRAAASVLLGTISFVLIAASVAGLAMYVDDMSRAREAAVIMGLLLLEMGVVLGALTALAVGTGGIGAGVILAIAGALAIMGFAMVEVAASIAIGVAAFEKLISVLNPQNAHQVVSFFEIIGDGIGSAGQHIADGIQTAADAIHGALASIKQETDSVGFDVAHGLASGLTKYAPLVAIAGAALGAMAIFGIRSDEGVDAHSDSRKSILIGYDVDHGLGTGLTTHAGEAIGPAKNLGFSVIQAIADSVSSGMQNVGFKDIAANVAKQISSKPINFANIMDFTSGKKSFGTLISSLFTSYGTGAVEGFQNGVTNAVGTATSEGGGGLMDMFTGMFSGLTSGNFDNVLGGFDWSTLLGEGGIGGLKTYLDEAGVSMDNLSGDNIPKLIEKLKEGGLAGDDLIAALKELGITEDQLKDLGLADKLGIEEAKDGIKDTEEALKSLADEIISGKFGNAPERWDKMFEHLVKSGKTAEEAYAAIADAQNEVNKRLGSSVVHTADEMSKKVSESVKKANQAQANAKAKGETGKAGRDFKTDPFKSDSKVSKEDAALAAEQQMLNNMPYENVKLTKEKQITAEREKQTVEAYKQKLANEHMYTLAEKQEALKGLKANEEIARQASLTTEKKKQLDAENARYQKVVDTYDEQQKMLKSIQDQESATKKAEEAEKKRGDAVKASSGAVVYGTEEYYKQTGKTGGTINTVAARPKAVETKPVEAETKVEVTPKFEVKNADTTKLKTEVINKVETEFKELQAKATITPKIDTSQAESAINNFKQKTQDLKSTIPQTFAGISTEVSKHLSTVASKISQEGSKIANSTKTVFQNAVSAAVTILNGNETINKFVNAGQSAGQGYANGIRAKIAEVRSAGTALGNTAIKATKAVTKTNSPSKIFTQLGEWNGIGYGNGMLDSISYVTSASSKMADASLDEVYRVVNAVEDAVSNGLDVNPTVTPVIDTTQIQNGISSMRSVMDMSSVDAAAITANMSAKASYDDTQVEEMRNRMESMGAAFNELADIISNQPDPTVNANVYLQGDAAGIFRQVRNENTKYTKMHGKSALA